MLLLTPLGICCGKKGEDGRGGTTPPMRLAFEMTNRGNSRHRGGENMKCLKMEYISQDQSSHRLQPYCVSM